jgi:hypothetical protein
MNDNVFKLKPKIDRDIEEFKQEEAAATNILQIFRGNEGRINAVLMRNENRINSRIAARQAAVAKNKQLQRI